MPYLGNPSPAHTHTNPVFPLYVVLTIASTLSASIFSLSGKRTKRRTITDFPPIISTGLVTCSKIFTGFIITQSIALSDVGSRIARKKRSMGYLGGFDPLGYDPLGFETEAYGPREIIAISDTVTGIKTRLLQIVQSIATSGVATVAVRAARSIAETLGISEVLTRPTTKFRPLNVETLTSSDILNRIKKTSIRIFGESITISELLIKFKRVPAQVIPQSIAIAEAVTRRGIKIRSSTNIIAISELVSKSIPKIRTITQSITTTGALTKTARKVQSLFESILSGEAITRIAKKYRQTTQNAYAILFNGTTQYINAGTSSVFKVAEALGQSGSISCWVYITANPPTNAYIFRRGVGIGNSSIRVRIDTSGILNVQVLHSNNTGGTSTAGAIPLNTWTNVVITINASNNEIKCYVAAVLKFTRTSPVLPLHDSDGSGNRFLIGASPTGATTQSEFLPGLIDGFRIYDRVLTPAEITVLNAGYNVQTGLTAWFKMNEGVGTTTRDDIGGIEATLVNTPTWSTNFPVLYYENIFLSETISRARQVAKSLTSSITTTGALTRVKSLFRIAVDFVATSGVLNRIKKISFRSFAESLATSGVVTISRRKVTSIAQTVTTTGVLNIVQRIKRRTIADVVAITDALNRISRKIRSIASSIGTTGVLSKGIGITKQIAQSITTTGALTRRKTLARSITDAISTTGIASIVSTIFLSLAESISTSGVASVVRQKVGIIAQSITTTAALTVANRRKFRSIAQSILSSTVTTARRIFLAGVTWVIAGKTTDFEDKIETMAMSYVEDNWRAVVLPVMASGTNYSNEVTQGDFSYDHFRTYYIRVKEGVSQVDNRQTRANLYTFTTPIEFEVSVRRLTKGESFPELNAMINELLRIWGQYQEDDVFGVKGVTFDSITPIEKNGSAYRSVWSKSLKITLHYYKAAVIQV